ncbi:MAG: hypothetical protein F4032_03420 [Gemmatimonadetes bacterium]|nr:hypothetical protein [Gemmatimonadota bacterium]
MSITPPYRDCPKCKKANCFGFYANSMDDNIEPKMYRQKCSACGHGELYFLPSLDKKIIYLDQFALSEMLKSIDPSVPRRGPLNPIWRTLFNKLEQLSRKQLIVCPKSDYHTIESLPTTYYPKLKILTEYLSWHVSFHRSNSIKMRQIEKHAQLWIQGKGDEEPTIEYHDALKGRINYWHPRDKPRIHIIPHLLEIEEIQHKRAKDETEIASLHDGWRSESYKSREQWFEETVKVFGLHTIHRPWPPYVEFKRSVEYVFLKEGVSQAHIEEKVIEYFNSPQLKNLPFLKISALLLAAKARRVAGGQKKRSLGMPVDFDMIATFLPYCDAMILDKECHSFLKEKAFKEISKYGAQLFSMRCIDKFAQYLDDIESTGCSHILSYAQDVYDWKMPFDEIYAQYLRR